MGDKDGSYTFQVQAFRRFSRISGKLRSDRDLLNRAIFPSDRGDDLESRLKNVERVSEKRKGQGKELHLSVKFKCDVHVVLFKCDESVMYTWFYLSVIKV